MVKKLCWLIEFLLRPFAHAAVAYLRNVPCLIQPTGTYTNANDVSVANAKAISNPVGRGAILIIDITTNAGALGSLTVTLVGCDPVSGKRWTILATTALTAVATTILRVYPGLTAAANAIASDVLPSQVGVSLVHNANPIVYSVQMELLGL